MANGNDWSGLNSAKVEGAFKIGVSILLAALTFAFARWADVVEKQGQDIATQLRLRDSGLEVKIEKMQDMLYTRDRELNGRLRALEVEVANHRREHDNEVQRDNGK